MSYVIRLIGLADGRPTDFDGEYLTKFDPDFRNGLGRVWTTPDQNKAKLFGDLGQVIEFWKITSRVRPMREDGKPNRPLTAFTIEPVAVP